MDEKLKVINIPLRDVVEMHSDDIQTSTGMFYTELIYKYIHLVGHQLKDKAVDLQLPTSFYFGCWGGALQFS